MVVASNRTNPFPGLRPFELDEEHLFFGREGQSDELIYRLNRTRFLGVVGTSGSGKSSLVRAGLLPSLYSGFLPDASSSWRIAILRPGSAPIRNLAEALNGPEVFGVEADSDEEIIRIALTESTLRRGSLGLVEVTQQARMDSDENLLVVVDQFEELFRFKAQAQAAGNRLEAEDEAAAFVKLLLAAVKQQEVPIFVVLTMRSDFLGDCAQFRDLPETLNDSQYLIPRLTREQLRRAIEGPVAVGGATITPRLVNRLLNDTGDNPDQLPILQHALMRTCDYWEDQQMPEAPLDLEHYEAIGGMAQALSLHADQIYEGLPDERSRQLAETLFRCLTDRSGEHQATRRPTQLSEICAITNATFQEILPIINEFRAPGRSFLMPPIRVSLQDQSIIDISHESLIRIWEKLHSWSIAEAESARIYQRLTETALLYKDGKAELLRDPELTIVWDWKKRNKLNEAWAERYNQNFREAILFLEKSIALRYKSERKRVDEAIQRQIDSKGTYDVFISYARKDKNFTQKLYSSLKDAGFVVWIDWEDISPGLDWQNAVIEGISASKNLVYIISPDAVKSVYLENEIESAVQFGKRIIPIYYRETAHEEIHPVISQRNWIFSREDASFEQMMKSLVQVLGTDEEYVRYHTRLLQASIEWESKDRDPSYLLTGEALIEAEDWIQNSKLKEPQPTHLQRDYVSKSRLEKTRKDRHRTLEKILSPLLAVLISVGFSSLAVFQDVLNLINHIFDLERQDVSPDPTEDSL